jgi:hypothetical protein
MCSQASGGQQSGFPIVRVQTFENSAQRFALSAEGSRLRRRSEDGGRY